ncbi:electron transport complex protein RnfE [Caldicoprobacter guelmensis]|uniref:RnfABCDGE type electron transport complex subunit E n=1 Tax=Caldicoprobacter guelmensis TaxID=1170224 RepID=UPI00195EB6E2|nr:electron transport complex subunit E [Caldicoprobacter guelmensis]MBM7581735.1 electron transport complex protein RnfE [Caldicoprobacter guelmensis]
MKALKVFFNGVLNENPTFRMVLGMCPTLALTTAAINGIGMGLATTFVLVGSNLVISLLKSFISQKIRIPAFVVVIATFVTVVSMVMQAFLPELNKSLGIYIPLIVVNCIILARAEAFASKNSVLLSIMDGLGIGIGFTLALLLLGSIREIVGAGTWFGVPLFSDSFSPAVIMILPPGGFITLGLVLGLLNKLTGRAE